MTCRISCALCLVATAALAAHDSRGHLLLAQDGRHPNATSSSSVASSTPTRASTLERFLADTEPRLVSYRALRRLSVTARGGKMTASLTALRLRTR